MYRDSTYTRHNGWLRYDICGAIERVFEEWNGAESDGE